MLCSAVLTLDRNISQILQEMRSVSRESRMCDDCLTQTHRVSGKHRQHTMRHLQNPHRSQDTPTATSRIALLSFITNVGGLTVQCQADDNAHGLSVRECAVAVCSQIEPLRGWLWSDDRVCSQSKSPVLTRQNRRKEDSTHTQHSTAPQTSHSK